MSAIFISHSSNDDAVAREVKDWLVEQGHRSVFLDFDPEAGIPAGRSWEQELYQQLRACRAVIVLCSEHSMSSRWCFAEITHARALGKPVFPIKIAPCNIDAVLTDRQVLDLAKGRDDTFQRLARGLSLAGLDAANLFDWDGSRPPYPGLLCFGEDDAAIFFGRDKEIGEGLDLITQMKRYGGAGLLLLLGASGSGKSSLMRAGIVPRLKRDPDQWLVVDPFRPGERPVANLSAAMAAAFDRHDQQVDWQEVRDRLVANTQQTSPGASLVTDLLLGSEHRDATVVVCIDQFEELLGHPAEHVASRFLVDLRATLDPPRGSHLVVATLRSDFLESFQQHPALRGIPFRSLSLGPMPVEGLAEIIEKPAGLAGLDVESGLVQALLEDTESEDALPLLAFTLRELYELASGEGHLGVSQYRDTLGGLRGSVAKAADTVLTARTLSEDDEEALRGAFLGMVRVDEDGHFARRSAGWQRLPDGAHDWLERFVQARLLVSRGDDENRTLEVAHEALFRAWDKLAGWLDENREALLMRQELSQASRVWDDAGRAEEDLWRGGRLQRSLEIRDKVFDRRLQERDGEAAGGRLPVSARELEFLEAAATVEQKRQRRRRRRSQAVVVAALLVAVIMSLLFVQARRERFSARTQTLAEQAASRRHDQLDLALLLSLEVERRGGDFDARRLLYEGLESSPWLDTLLHGHRDDVRAVAWSPDGKLLASASGAEPAVVLWDVASEQPVARSLAGAAAGVWSLAFSPDGSQLAAGGADGAALVWQVYAAPGEPRRLIDAAQPPKEIYAVAWSPDGRLLATARSDLKIEVWDVAGQQLAGPLLTGASDWLKSLAWSPDGVTLAAGGMDKKVRRWDVATGEPLAALSPDHEEGVMSLAYSPDGALLASGSLDGTVALWGESERVGQPLDSLIGAVASVAWSEEAVLAVGGTDGRLVLWDVARRRPLAAAAEGQAAALLGLTWSPDGDLVASGNGPTVVLWRADGGPRLGQRVELGASEVRSLAVSRDGTSLAAVGRDPVSQELGIRLWDLAKSETVSVLPSTVRRPPTIHWGVGKRSLLTAGLDRKIKRWEATTGRVLAEWQIELPSSRPSSLAWNPRGFALAIGGRDGGVALWEMDGGASAAPLSVPAAEESRITALAWDATGQRLAAGAADGTLRLWNDASGAGQGILLAGHGSEGAVTRLAWSPDGKVLASAGRDRTVRLWAADSNRQNGEALTHADAVIQLAWSADGTTLATASNDRRILLWDVATRSIWAGPFLGHEDTLSGLWFNHDDTILTSVSVDGVLRHWDVDVSSWRRRICRIAGRNLTQVEWQRYVLDTPYLETCSNVPKTTPGDSES